VSTRNDIKDYSLSQGLFQSRSLREERINTADPLLSLHSSKPHFFDKPDKYLLLASATRRSATIDMICGLCWMTQIRDSRFGLLICPPKKPEARIRCCPSGLLPCSWQSFSVTLAALGYIERSAAQNRLDMTRAQKYNYCMTDNTTGIWTAQISWVC
jgi:hypothetical protein